MQPMWEEIYSETICMQPMWKDIYSETICMQPIWDAVCAMPYMCHALDVPRPISAPCPVCAMRYMCHAL